MRLNELAAETLEWLWPGRIGLGKLTLLLGDPGVGKSFLTLDLAARVSSGTSWPDSCQIAPRGSVILMNAEDSLSDTIRPRLEAAGADLRRVLALSGVRSDTEHQQTISLTTDMASLRKALIKAGDCRLLVIDPITAYSGGINQHSSADIRSILTPLAELAAEFRVAIVAVSHFTKRHTRKAIHRALGSIAFVAAARSVWCVTEDPDRRKRRLLLPVKGNLAEDVDGLAFALQQAPGQETARVVWERQPVTATVDEVLEANFYRNSPRRVALTRETTTVRWLREQLADGAISHRDLAARARVAVRSRAQLNRAARHLNVIKTKAGFREGWTWSLPRVEEGDEAMSQPGRVARFLDCESLG